MSSIATILIVAAAIFLGVAIAYVPMRLLVSHMAKTVRQFIERQRDRRRQARDTPDRRKVAEAAASVVSRPAAPAGPITAPMHSPAAESTAPPQSPS